jgi:pimeloyl-ACP methyl ester carboxylesterase
MAVSTLTFLGGNGHCAARLFAARACLPAGVDLIAVPYPGFEGRQRAANLEGFLTAITDHLRSAGPHLVYATGIGGLLALCLRARGALAGVPILLQGPVLWGLERRMMPRLMRFAPMQWALSRVFASAAFQRRFVGKYFTRAPDPETAAAFFAGYAQCSALPDFFAWLTPALLRSLETALAGRPEALADIRIWWGGRDAVVSPRELEWTVSALGPMSESVARWPVRMFPEWGHYPMIDTPAEWAQEVAGALAAAEAV